MQAARDWDRQQTGTAGPLFRADTDASVQLLLSRMAAPSSLPTNRIAEQRNAEEFPFDQIPNCLKLRKRYLRYADVQVPPVYMVMNLTSGCMCGRMC